MYDLILLQIDRLLQGIAEAEATQYKYEYICGEIWKSRNSH